MAKKILVTGADGFLGTKLMDILPNKGFEVVGTTLCREKPRFIFLDIRDRENTIRVISNERPDAVIHTAAITNVDWSETKKEETFETNVKGTENVALGCKEIGAKIILISTDYVFDGSKEDPYTEEDKCNPLGVYAESKLEAEKTVMKTDDNYIIARVNVLYGYNGKNDKKTFVNWVADSLRNGKEINAFKNQYSCPTLIDDIAYALATLIEKDRKGIYLVAGKEYISRLEFARKIAKAFGLDESLIKEGSLANSSQLAKRPKHIKCDISKLESEGINMSTIDEGLAKIKQQMGDAE